MPKIVKNGLEYSGTPLEEVTAWPPTGDSVQIEQPLMGNTDISEVGDGTVTGAIAQNTEDITELNNGLIKYVDITANPTANANVQPYTYYAQVDIRSYNLDLSKIVGMFGFSVGSGASVSVKIQPFATPQFIWVYARAADAVTVRIVYLNN